MVPHGITWPSGTKAWNTKEFQWILPVFCGKGRVPAETSEMRCQMNQFIWHLLFDNVLQGLWQLSRVGNEDVRWTRSSDILVSDNVLQGVWQLSRMRFGVSSWQDCVCEASTECACFIRGSQLTQIFYSLRNPRSYAILKDFNWLFRNPVQ